MIYEHIDCIICGTQQTTRFIEVKDRLSQSQNSFKLVQCQCKFIYLNPRPNSYSISSYYKSEYYDPHRNINNIWSSVYKIIKTTMLRWKY